MADERACTASPGRTRFVALTPAERDLDLALRAFPGAAAADFAALGLAPAPVLRADDAARGAAALCGGPALVVTSLDLAHPDLPSLVGWSDARRGAAVVSFARLRDPWDDGVTVRRVRNVAAHEAGHVQGLRHCDDPACVMHRAGGCADLDRRGDAPCAACRGARRPRVRRATEGVRR